MIRGDFHMHTRYSHDCMVEPEALVKRCQEVGLSCIAVTDHNTIKGARAVQAIAPFRVILGEEIKTTAGEITGLFLTEEVPPGLTPADTVRRIKEQGGLVSLPHPFDRMGRSPLAPRFIDELLPYVDLVEAFNARTLLMRDNAQGHQMAVNHGLLVTAVSDAHTLGELGRSYTEMPEFDGTPEGFKAALIEARLMERRSSPLVHLYSTINKFRSKKPPLP
jgi:predicted metal-dependent phosphoesterase TrpH